MSGNIEHILRKLPENMTCCLLTTALKTRYKDTFVPNPLFYIAFMFQSFYIALLRPIFSFHQEKDIAVVSSPFQKPCQLNCKVQSLLELICDLKAMEEYVLEMKFDTKKAPLGVCVCVQLKICMKIANETN